MIYYMGDRSVRHKSMEKCMDSNIKRITDYFREGEKAKCTATGVEIEHFIIGKDGNSMAYEKVVKVMEKLIGEKDILFKEDGHLLGFYNDEYSITLEPASQMEISIAPKEHIAEIKEIYENFREKADKILEEEGFRFVNTGYHPYKRAEELELIPKKRYEYMNNYFEKTGKLGKNMMRATASVQVSIDYESEQDFVEKYRLACILSPILYFITSNSPVFEGKKAKNEMVRALVWMNTDKVRCGIFPGTFAEDFGYDKYAKYLYENPPILIKDEKGNAVFTGNKKLSEIYNGKEMTKNEIEYAISMFFPDVRLKNYIEIRMADSMESEDVLAYTALIKSIFYQKEIRKILLDFFGEITEEKIEQAKNSLIEKGNEGEIYGRTLKESVTKIKALLEEYADEEAGSYIKCGKLFGCAEKCRNPIQKLR